MANFEVLIIGSDMNAYYMARNFNEEYNIKPHLIGKEPMAFTNNSKILTIEFEPNLWDNDVFTNTLINYAKKKKYDSKILLVATNDHYVRLIVENKKDLEKYYIFNYPSLENLNRLLIKENFYKEFKDSILEFPKTYFYKVKSGFDEKNIEYFRYPIIIKPSNGIDYYDHSFIGQAKVYKLNTLDEIREIIKKIEDSGYSDNLIIQEFIPGDDSRLFDSMFYVNSKGKVELQTFAQIGLQEHTPTGIGNCTVLVNGFNEFNNTSEIKDKLVKFLESINYNGICEFDLKYDERDNKFKVFEINPRQARCGYYVTACGYNLAKYLVEDLIENKEHEFHFIDEKIAFSFVPKTVIEKYITNQKLKDEIHDLMNKNKFCRPLRNKKDNGLQRKKWLILRDINYIKKYKNNKW